MNEYLYRNRPPGIGCQPTGGNISEVWYPIQEKNTPIGPRTFFGKVVYDEPLTFDEINRYELFPVDRLEWAKYQIWEESRWDGEYLPYRIGQYQKLMAKLPQSDLAELEEDEPITFAILTIFSENNEDAAAFAASL